MKARALIPLLVALPWLATPLAAQCVDKASDAEPAKEPPPMVRGFNISGIANNTIPDAKAWGINVVRLQIFPINRAARWHKPMWDAWPIVLDTLVEGVKIAAANDIKVVVDLHEAPIEGVEGSAMWHSPDLAKNFCRAWADIARRLLPYRSTIWGYDLYNEPLDRAQLPRAPKEWAPLAEQIIRTIRSIDRETWIVFESGPGYTFNGLADLKPLSDRRVVYSGHVYDPFAFVNQGTSGTKQVIYYRDKSLLERALEIPIRFQDKHHVPIFVGEFSVVRWAPHDDAVRWLKDAIDIFEQHHWSWAYHIFRDYTAWSLEDDDTWWKPGDPSPARATTMTDRGKVVKEALARNHAR
jgi:aryl-phospho-beta-D-glucosidase BglC (GH1 family)